MLSAVKKSRATSGDDDLDITPMIDVTFLLLIFFMVTSNMEESSRLQIPPASHGMGVPTDQSSVITIYKTEGDPEVFLGDENVRDKALATDMGMVTAYVQKVVQDGKLNVIIKADRDVPTVIVDEVARAANDVDVPGGELKFFLGVVDKP